jgi:hypothetical protein
MYNCTAQEAIGSKRIRVLDVDFIQKHASKSHRAQSPKDTLFPSFAPHFVDSGVQSQEHQEGSY